MVVGIADDILREAQVKGEFRQACLKPKVLFNEPGMTRSTSNFNENKFLIDDETVEIIADFCFPNGVQILRVTDFRPGEPLESQSEEL